MDTSEMTRKNHRGLAGQRRRGRGFATSLVSSSPLPMPPAPVEPSALAAAATPARRLAALMETLHSTCLRDLVASLHAGGHDWLGAILPRSPSWALSRFATPAALATMIRRGLSPDFLSPILRHVSPDARHDGFSMLGLASRHGQWQAIDLLLSLGADPRLTDADGRTPLMHAIVPACARRLLPRSDVLARQWLDQALSYERGDALCFAIDRGAVETSILLAEATRAAVSSRPETALESGRSGYEQAIQNEQPAIADALAEFASRKDLAHDVDRFGPQKMPRAHAIVESQALRAAVSADGAALGAPEGDDTSAIEAALCANVPDAARSAAHRL
jgi:hypothetical protein